MERSDYIDESGKHIKKKSKHESLKTYSIVAYTNLQNNNGYIILPYLDSSFAF